MENSKDQTKNTTPAPTLSIDFGQARGFVEFLTGDKDTPVTFQTFSDDPGIRGGRIVTGALDAKQCRTLSGLNESGHGVFVTVNAIDPKCPGQRKNSLVSDIRAVFLDFDDPKDVADSGGHLKAVIAEAKQMGIPPNGIVLSSGKDGGRWHLYWLITPEPVTESGEAAAQFKIIQQYLAKKWHGDPAISDVARVMRLPGFIHRKDKPVKTVFRIIDKSARTSLKDLQKALNIPDTHVSKEAAHFNAMRGANSSAAKRPRLSNDIIELKHWIAEKAQSEIDADTPENKRLYRFNPDDNALIDNIEEDPRDQATGRRLVSAIEHLSHTALPDSKDDSDMWVADRDIWLKCCFAIARAILNSDIDEDEERQAVTALSTHYDFEKGVYSPLDNPVEGNKEFDHRAALGWDAYEQKAAEVYRDPSRPGVTINSIFKWALDTSWDGARDLLQPKIEPAPQLNLPAGMDYHVVVKRVLDVPIELCDTNPTMQLMNGLQFRKTVGKGNNVSSQPTVCLKNIESLFKSLGVFAGINCITGHVETNITLFEGGNSMEKDTSIAFRTHFNDWLKHNFLGAPGGHQVSKEFLNTLLDGPRRYNPVLAHLTPLVWDGVDRFSEVADCMDVADRQILDYALQKFFIGAVAAADYAEHSPHNFAEPKFDLVFTLQGPQGIGKTQFFGSLLPKELKEYYRTGVRLGGTGSENKDAIMLATSGWIVELGELDSTFSRKGNSETKGFLSNSVDSLRLPYGEKIVATPRQSIYVGSVNPSDFLTDPTGARRYLPVSVSSIDAARIQKIDKDQLWAQAMKMYLDGAHWWVDTHRDDADTLRRIADNQSLHSSKSDNDSMVEAIAEVLEKIYDWSILEAHGPLKNAWNTKNGQSYKSLIASGCKETPQRLIHARVVEEVQGISEWEIDRQDVKSQRVRKAILSIASKAALEQDCHDASMGWKRPKRTQHGETWMMPPTKEWVAKQRKKKKE